MPINIQPCNPELQIFNSPHANDIFERSFTLPIYNNMTSDECDLVIDFCNKL
jgi:dTDP-4-amino-4,6-dideoxygalactose transaminase